MIAAARNAVRPVVESQRGPHEQQLGRASPDGTPGRPRSGPVSSLTAAGRRNRLRGTSVADGSAKTRAPSASQRFRLGIPGQAELREPGRRLGTRRRLNLRGGQQVGKGVEVVADADPALGAGLERGRAASRERVEDDVTRPRVPGDERMGQGRREAREVRAHRVERVAPQPLLRPSTPVRGRSPAVRAGVRARAGPRRARAMALGSVRPTSASRNLPGHPRRSPAGAMGRGA